MAAQQKPMSRRELLFGLVSRIQDTDTEPEANEAEDVDQEAVNNLAAGREAYESGEFEKAIDYYRLYTRAEPDHVEARKVLGFCLYSQGQTIQARVEFERVIRIQKQDNFAALYLGLCLLKVDKLEKAAKAWKSFEGDEDDPIGQEIAKQLAALEEDAPAKPSVVEAAINGVQSMVDQKAAQLA